MRGLLRRNPPLPPNLNNINLLKANTTDKHGDMFRGRRDFLSDRNPLVVWLKALFGSRASACFFYPSWFGHGWVLQFGERIT